MKVNVARSIVRRVAQEAEYYRRKRGEEYASRIIRDIRKAINGLATHQRGHYIDGLPLMYRRLNVKPFYICYLLEETELTVYLLRGQRQKPLRPQDHKAMATKAKRDSIEFN